MELRSKLARRPPARLFAVGEYDNDAWLIMEVEHVGCLLHGCCQRCAAGGHQVIYNTQNKVRSVGRWLKLKFDVVALVGTPRTKGNEANAAMFGKTLANADRTFSMRRTIFAPAYLPDMEPDASNAIMASSLHVWCCDSCAPEGTL